MAPYTVSERQDPKMFAANNGTTEEIIKKIHLAREKLEKSLFYGKFMAQMQDPEMVTRIENLINTDPQHYELS
jgi:hypothetical protein